MNTHIFFLPCTYTRTENTHLIFFLKYSRKPWNSISFNSIFKQQEKLFTPTNNQSVFYYITVKRLADSKFKIHILLRTQRILWF